MFANFHAKNHSALPSILAKVNIYGKMQKTAKEKQVKHVLCVK